MKRMYACSRAVWFGPVAMNIRSASSSVRTIEVWHSAQLFVIRGKPIVFLLKPTGVSSPGSHGKPNEA